MLDFIQELGELALASRLRRLSDLIIQDVAPMYQSLAIEFEPRWFAVFCLLQSSEQPLSIMEIAKRLQVTHPLVNQVASELIKAGYVETLEDLGDKRKRLLKLSDKAWQILPHVEPIWKDVELTARELVLSTGYDVLAVLQKLEGELQRVPFYQRYQAVKKRREQGAVEIVQYQPQWKSVFASLNQAWIEQYFEMEPMDWQVLSDPETQILAIGGYIFFALIDGHPVGTCALIPLPSPDSAVPAVYELAKMAVDEAYQGRQIGRKLIEHALAFACEIGAETVMLETNSRLKKAVQLYRSVGFELVSQPEPSWKQFQRVDMVMQLNLKTLQGGLSGQSVQLVR